MGDVLDGLLSFFASHHAIRAEKLLHGEGYAVDLIPGPKELSPNCGVALRFEFARRAGAIALLSDHGVEVDEVHEYQPRTDQWQKPERTAGEKRRVWGRRRR